MRPCPPDKSDPLRRSKGGLIFKIGVVRSILASSGVLSHIHVGLTPYTDTPYRHSGDPNCGT